MRSPFPAILAALLGAAAAEAYVGQWHSYTGMERAHALLVHGGRVYAGTTGGIRSIDPANLSEVEYDNLDGLLDCWITGLAETGDRSLWAVSRSGYLYVLKRNRWETHGRSFASARWTMNDRAVLAAGQFLFLGSEKGLAVFDADRKVSQANITRFGTQLDLSVLSLLRKADTLYVGTPEGVYKAGVDFANPLNPAPRYGSLLDPQRWLKVEFPPDSAGTDPRQFALLKFKGDSLATYGPGTILDSPFTVSALAGDSLRIAKKAYNLDWVTSAVAVGGKMFGGGPWGVVYVNDARRGSQLLAAVRRTQFPVDPVANIVARGDQVWGHSIWGLHPFRSDGFPLSPIKVASSGAMTERYLKNLVLDDKGDLYIGSWGQGVLRVRDGKLRGWDRKSDTCLVEVAEDYPVVYAISNVRNGGVFFSMFRAETAEDHQLAYLDTRTERLSCLDSSVAGGHPHAVRSFSDTLLGVGSDRGISFFKVREGALGPVLTSLGLWTVEGQANEVWDLSEDASGRPWVLIGNQLAFSDSVGRIGFSGERKLSVAEGFPGSECRLLRKDPVGLFWAGCGNGLFQVEPAAEGVGRVRRFGLDDGLLSLKIHDISVNPVNGQVWIATDRGVSMLESASQPPVAELKTVRAYPNPFRPHHHAVIFDRLPRNSTVRVHNSAGDVVRILRPAVQLGSQAQWDGKNQDGRPVAPGVYLYSVVSGSTVERGKIIVAR